LSTQYLRLTPRDTTRQKVLDWTLATPGPALRTTDGYGNVLHVLTIDKPVTAIVIQAQGSVETAPALDEPSDFTGAPLSPLLFLRPTGLTRADETLATFA
jgi:transglutaminase-like putative cysteine protease